MHMCVGMCDYRTRERATIIKRPNDNPSLRPRPRPSRARSLHRSTICLHHVLRAHARETRNSEILVCLDILFFFVKYLLLRGKLHVAYDTIIIITTNTTITNSIVLTRLYLL